jgi:hypothetical protein
MHKGRHDFDDIAWDRSDGIENVRTNQCWTKATRHLIESFAKAKHGQPASLMPPLAIGGFNLYCRICFNSEESEIIVRLPFGSSVQFSGEKILYEAATAEFVRRNTSVRTAQVFHYKQRFDIDPFLILRYIESHDDIIDPLAVPDLDPNDTPVLNLALPTKRLKSLWDKTAGYQLEPAKHTFPHIDSLVEIEGSIQVTG